MSGEARSDGAEALRIAIGGESVSALLLAPPSASAAYVFAHGAGAGMEHAFMAAFARGLAEREVATLRFQFPFMEKGGRRVDPPALAQAAVRAACDAAHERLPELALFAGGKSFGGRMSSQAEASSHLSNVRGLVFVGFPLHPAGKPGIERAAHLAEVKLPMLFLQGTRDELAELELLVPVLEELGPRATLERFDDADHAFHVRARSGRNDAQVLEAMLDTTVSWMALAAGR